MRSLFLFLFIWPSLLWADGSHSKVSKEIASLESGVICGQPHESERLAPNTVAGVTHVVTGDLDFVSTKNRVPAVLGIGFGIKAQSRVSGGLNQVEMFIRHPPMGDTGATEQSFMTTVTGNSPNFTFYQFDFDYELVPGRWTMEAWQGNLMLFRVTFDVVPAHLMPELATICGFEELLF